MEVGSSTIHASKIQASKMPISGTTPVYQAEHREEGTSPGLSTFFLVLIAVLLSIILAVLVMGWTHRRRNHPGHSLEPLEDITQRGDFCETTKLTGTRNSARYM